MRSTWKKGRTDVVNRVVGGHPLGDAREDVMPRKVYDGYAEDRTPPETGRNRCPRIASQVDTGRLFSGRRMRARRPARVQGRSEDGQQKIIYI